MYNVQGGGCMTSGINLSEIIVANIIGIMLSSSMLINSRLGFSQNKREFTYTKSILICTLVSSIIDALTFMMDGKEGIFPYICVYFGNMWLFLCNIIIGLLWVSLVGYHLEGKKSRVRRYLYGLTVVPGVLLLLVNLFHPIVYSVNTQNIYARGPLYWFYNFIAAVFILDSVIMYIRAKLRGGALKFFPIFQFIIPVLIGIAFQSLIYGISVTWPCIAISISSVIYSLQSEVAYRDQLTGLFNRFYLDVVKKDFERRKNGKISALMLDMNDFKVINDTYGHSEGDEALITIAKILQSVVGSFGSVLRFAGDEFVILLNTQNYLLIDSCVNEIQNEIKKYNLTSKKEYELSVSIGFSFVDLKERTIDEMLHDIDHKMYEEKRKYYQTHDRRKRG